MLRKPAKPIILRISAVSGSSSTSIVASGAFDSVEVEGALEVGTEGPVVVAGAPLGLEVFGMEDDGSGAAGVGF